MRMRSQASQRKFLRTALIGCGLCALLTIESPRLARAADNNQLEIFVVDVVPPTLSFEDWNDSEVTLAINTRSPNELAISSLTPSPVQGGGTDIKPGFSRAPIFLSQDGGATWLLSDILPAVGPITKDVSVSFSPVSGALYAALTQFGGSSTLAVARADLDLPSMPMKQVQVEELPGDDQPMLSVPGTHSSLVVSANSRTLGARAEFLPGEGTGSTPKRGFISLDDELAGAEDAPSVRVASAPDGTIYATFLRLHPAMSNSNMQDDGTWKESADVVVERAQNWGVEPQLFAHLMDTPKHRRGLIVSKAQIEYDDSISSQRIGGDLSIAVNPDDSRIVYLAWCDGASNNYRLHLARGERGGERWQLDIIKPIMGAVNPSLAVNSAGDVALLYQQFVSGRNSIWQTHVLILRAGSTIESEHIDRILAQGSPIQPIDQVFPILGEYDRIVSVGRDFFGAFAASNSPNCEDFPSGVVYNRSVDFNKHVLLSNLGNGLARVSSSMDPFFFVITSDKKNLPRPAPTSKSCKGAQPLLSHSTRAR